MRWCVCTRVHVHRHAVCVGTCVCVCVCVCVVLGVCASGMYPSESFLFTIYVHAFICVFVYVCVSELVACLGGLGAAV